MKIWLYSRLLICNQLNYCDVVHGSEAVPEYVGYTVNFLCVSNRVNISMESIRVISEEHQFKLT